MDNQRAKQARRNGEPAAVQRSAADGNRKDGVHLDQKACIIAVRTFDTRAFDQPGNRRHHAAEGIDHPFDAVHIDSRKMAGDVYKRQVHPRDCS